MSTELRELIGYNAVPHINCNKPFYWAEDVDRAFTKLLTELETLRARIAELEAALVSEREGNLWNAYNSGHVKDDQWTHMFMSDGEWLARECGFDPKAGFYDDQAIRKAIPIAARAALERKP